ncbi:MAG: carboxysome peptide B [Acidiferrobacterales bacterium]|jgi:carboxysome peptide B|nr:carboxysome peptide B [Acidiferrobacterales bacterium]
MEILQVEAPLVCTQRVSGLQHVALKVLRNVKTGMRQVAVDPVGCREGNWVFTSLGSAARYAAGEYSVTTDLTICGIIDYWEEEAS